LKTTKTVLDYFYEICAIPHGSGNTGAIADYCVNVAKELGLYVRKDEFNNVVIKKEASDDKKGAKPVIIQGHLDMVCAKTPDSDFDFLHDGIKCITDGDFIRAENTTLGGDDGIAVAYALALISDDTISHPPLEIILTADEEIGLVGANNIDVFDISGKQFINIDSEKEGIFTVSCAGGVRCDLVFSSSVNEVNGTLVSVTVSGLIGGHSGTQIHKRGQNANKLIGEILNQVCEKFDINLIGINGGSKENAIAVNSKAEFIAKTEDSKEIESLISNLSEEIKAVSSVDPDIAIDVKIGGEIIKEAFDITFSKKIAKALATCKNGVIAMDENTPGLVKTSLNLGVVLTEKNVVSLFFGLRSNDNKELENLKEEIRDFSEKYDAKFNSSGAYPAWEYVKDSHLRDVMCTLYKEMYGKDPKVVAIHAGLECGVFSGKLGGIDAVSMGPNVYDIHTVNERLSISSVERVWEFLKSVLKAL